MFSFSLYFLLLSLTIVLRWNWKYFLYLIIYIPRHGITESLEIMRCWKEVDCFGIRLFIGNSVPFSFYSECHIFVFYYITSRGHIVFVYFFFNGSKTCSWQRIKWDTFSSQWKIKRKKGMETSIKIPSSKQSLKIYKNILFYTLYVKIFWIF